MRSNVAPYRHACISLLLIRAISSYAGWACHKRRSSKGCCRHLTFTRIEVVAGWLAKLQECGARARQRGALAAQMCSSSVAQGSSRRPAALGGSSYARCVLPYRPGFAAQAHVNVLEPEWTWTLKIVVRLGDDAVHNLQGPRPLRLQHVDMRLGSEAWPVGEHTAGI